MPDGQQGEAAIHCRLCTILARLQVFAALMAMAIIPPGVMASHGDDGRIVMVLCSGDGAVRMVFDRATGAVTPEKPAPAKSGCDWGMARTATDLPAPAALPQPAFATHRAAPALASVLWHPAHDPRGIHARAPPLLT